MRNNLCAWTEHCPVTLSYHLQYENKMIALTTQFYMDSLTCMQKKYSLELRGCKLIKIVHNTHMKILYHHQL